MHIAHRPVVGWRCANKVQTTDSTRCCFGVFLHFPFKYIAHRDGNAKKKFLALQFRKLVDG